MNLYLCFMKLNSAALDIDTLISRYQISYLENNIEYPLEYIDKLLCEYMKDFDKAYSKKFSTFNEFMCKLSSRRYYYMDSLDAPHPKEILGSASEKTLFYILQNYKNYIPYDNISQGQISNKLYPIMRNVSDYRLVEFYNDFKRKIKVTNDIDCDLCIAYLQDMIVDCIMDHLMAGIHENNISQHIWTNEEVCNQFLKEPIFEIPVKGKKRVRKDTDC